MTMRSQPDDAHVSSDTLSDRINVAIKRAGGVTYVAAVIGVSESVLRKWRRGESQPVVRHLVHLATAANVNVAWLATGEGEREASTGHKAREPQSVDRVSVVDANLLEDVIYAATKQLRERGIKLKPRSEARLLRVLYELFASRAEKPDEATVSNVIDLAAHR